MGDADGRPAALFGSVQDMSGSAPERAWPGDEANPVAERRVEEERGRIVESLVDEVVFDWDVGSGRVRRSSGLHRLLGYSDEDGTFEWWSMRVHPDERDDLSRRIKEYARGGRGTWEARYRFRRTDGTYVAVRERAIGLLRAADGSATRIVGILALVGGPPTAPRGTVYLTPRQGQVLELVRDGSTSKEIAARLEISEQGVKDHVSSLLERFGVPNRAALVAAADAHDVTIQRRSTERQR